VAAAMKRITASTLVKITGHNGESCHGGTGVWPLPRGKRLGAWLKVTGKLVPCGNGLHVCTVRQALDDWPGPAMWLVEVRGERVRCANKTVVSEARLISRVETWNDRTLRLFAADCAASALNLAKSTDERSWAAIACARRFADGKASESELAAARAAACDAARDATRDAQFKRLLAALKGDPLAPIERAAL